MKSRYFPQINFSHSAFFLLAAFFLSSLTAFAQQTQLSLVDIITALRSKKATIAEKNQILTEGVKQRGVTFALNDDLEKELRTAGADENLIGAIRQKSPVIKVSATPQPKIEPTPAPVSTPRPPDASVYQNRANANFVMGEYDAAITDYTKAIELDSKNATVYFSRGMAFFNKKNFNPAIADFDKAIELDPSESMTFYNRGNALEKTGNFEKALADYQKAVELDADNELAKAAFQRLQAALPKTSPNVTTKEVVTTPIKETPKQESPKTVENPNMPFNAGSLKELAVKLAVPIYPQMERQNKTEGLVTVQVTLDEEGKVVSAKATNGPRGLRAASEDAAQRSKFKPFILDGKPVKSVGFVVYNFKLN